MMQYIKQCTIIALVAIIATTSAQNSIQDGKYTIIIFFSHTCRRRVDNDNNNWSTHTHALSPVQTITVRWKEMTEKEKLL